MSIIVFSGDDYETPLPETRDFALTVGSSATSKVVGASFSATTW
jgi:hypothetical protein